MFNYLEWSQPVQCLWGMLSIQAGSLIKTTLLPQNTSLRATLLVFMAQRLTKIVACL